MSEGQPKEIQGMIDHKSATGNGEVLPPERSSCLQCNSLMTAPAECLSTLLEAFQKLSRYEYMRSGHTQGVEDGYDHLSYFCHYSLGFKSVVNGELSVEFSQVCVHNFM